MTLLNPGALPPLVASCLVRLPLWQAAQARLEEAKKLNPLVRWALG